MTTEAIAESRWLGHFPRRGLTPSWQSLRPLYLWLVPNQGWVTFLLLFMVTLSVTWSVQSAEWVGTPGLSALVLAGLVSGLVLAKMPFHGLALQVLALIVGTATLLWYALRYVNAGPFSVGVSQVMERLGLWLDALANDGISTDPLPFAAALAVMIWLLGYLFSWFAFRHRSVWVPLILAGVGVMTNLSYLPSRHWSFFSMFLVSAMMVVAWMSMQDRHQMWSRHSVCYPPVLRGSRLFNAFVFGLVVVILGASLPFGVPRLPLLSKAYEYVSWPVEEFSGDFNRLFAGIPARKPLPFRIFDNTLPFRGTISLSDEIVFTLTASEPGYWRVRSYPTYTSQGWRSGPTRLVSIDQQPDGVTPREYEGREAVGQTVELNFSPRLLAAAGIAQESDIDVLVEVPVLPEYTLLLTDAFPDTSLPTDIRGLAQRLRILALATEGEITESDIRQALKEVVEVVGIETGDSGWPIAVTVKRPAPESPDILSFRSRRRMFSADSYSVTSSISVATAEQLREVGGEYPGWVRDLYLQLPETLPQRVRDLARDLTQDAETPYDKAVAIASYLRTMPYSQNIPPPLDADGVDHLLFKVGAGYSQYFSSAMAVMLRTVGVPSRVATGYSYGEVDEDGKVVVRDRNAHGWTEVFFPSYGWVEFEPTPGRERPIHIAEPAAGPAIPTGIRGGLDDDSADEDDSFGGGSSLPGRDPAGGLSLPWLLLGLSGAGMLGTALLLVLAIRWLIGTPAAVAGVYGKMVRLSHLAGLGPYTGQTPREYGARLARRLPAVKGEVTVVVDTYTKDIFGSRVVSEFEEATAMEAWRTLRRTLFAHVLRRPWPW